MGKIVTEQYCVNLSGTSAAYITNKCVTKQRVYELGCYLDIPENISNNQLVEESNIMAPEITYMTVGTNSFSFVDKGTFEGSCSITFILYESNIQYLKCTFDGKKFNDRVQFSPGERFKFVAEPVNQTTFSVIGFTVTYEREADQVSGFCTTNNLSLNIGGYTYRIHDSSEIYYELNSKSIDGVTDFLIGDTLQISGSIMFG